MNRRLRLLDPRAKVHIVRKEFEDERVGARDVRGITRERRPAKGAFPLGKKRSDIFGHKARNRKRVGEACVERHGTEVVPIVEGDGSAILHGPHGTHMLHSTCSGTPNVVVGIRNPQLSRLIHRQAVGDVSIQHVVGAGLIRDDVGGHAASHELGQNIRGVANKADRKRSSSGLCLTNPADRFVERCRHATTVARGESLLDSSGIDLDAQDRRTLHRSGQRLGATHSTQSRRQDKPAGERTAEMPLSDAAERFVRTLHDPLRANVDPRSRSHLPIHRESGAFQLAELLPCRPSPDEVGVGNENARGMRVRAKHGDRFAALDEQGLIVLEHTQRLDDGVEALPVARGLPCTAIHNQIPRPLGDLGIEVVHQHAQGGFLRPALAADRTAARRAHHAGF